MKESEWVIRMLVVLLVILIVSTCSYPLINITYWDGEVKELCEKEGGKTVFKAVSLSADEKSLIVTKGHVDIPKRGTKRSIGYPYVYDLVRTEIRKKNPAVIRSTHILYRKRDGAVLAKKIAFSRIGGGFSLGFQPSNFSCSKMKSYDSSPLWEGVFKNLSAGRL